MKPFGWIITFLSVVTAMAFFRAKTVAAAMTLVAGMIGLHGVSIPQSVLNRAGAAGRLLSELGVSGDLGSGNTFVFACTWLATLFAIVMFFPNSLEMWREFEPALYFGPTKAKTASATTPTSVPLARALDFQVAWNKRWAFASAALLVFGIFGLNRVSEFLYWQF